MRSESEPKTAKRLLRYLAAAFFCPLFRGALQNVRNVVD